MIIVKISLKNPRKNRKAH